MMRVADYIVERLHGAGVRHVYMVTGRGLLFLSDAVAKRTAMRGISMHHEQAAAYAAVAEAQHGGRLGACMVSTGCAATNAMTGVLNAWQDGVPCIFISGQNPLRETVRHTGLPLRTFGSQETDVVPLVASITKYAVMIEDPAQIAYEMDKALHLAQSGWKGPVWIDVPLDVQNMRVEPEALVRWSCEERRARPSDEDMRHVRECLARAERPVVLIGAGVRAAGAIPELRAFLDECPLPLAFANSAVDTLGSGDPLSMGAVGSLGGSRAGNFAVQNADLLLVVGCRLSPMTTGSEYAKFARAAQIIVVDIDGAEHAKQTVKIDRLIRADAKEFLLALAQSPACPASEAWLAKCRHWKSVFPKCETWSRTAGKIDLYYLAESLSAVMPEDAILLTDAGLEELIVPSAIDFKPGQRCIHPASQGSMGFALPAAVGAHLSSGKSVIVVVGDGSIMMNLQELQTIRQYNVPAKLIVVNNNAYAIIRKRQVELFRNRTIGTDPSNGVSCPAFDKVADCFGLPYVRIEESSDLPRKMRELLERPGPVLCEVIGLENQDYLANSHALNAARRYVRRPLEDQAPFLERSRFLSEMIVDPIDQ